MAKPAQPDLTVSNQIIERETRNLLRQQAALKGTLAELEYLFELNKETPGAIPPNTTMKLRTKRDRQHSACVATQGLITALQARKGV